MPSAPLSTVKVPWAQALTLAGSTALKTLLEHYLILWDTNWSRISCKHFLQAQSFGILMQEPGCRRTTSNSTFQSTIFHLSRACCSPLQSPCMSSHYTSHGLPRITQHGIKSATQRKPEFYCTASPGPRWQMRQIEEPPSSCFFSSAAVAFGQPALPSLHPSIVNVTTSGTTNLPRAGPVNKREDMLAPMSAAVPFGQLALPSVLPTLINVTTSGTTNLPGAGPVNKRGDTLAPLYANLYSISVPAGVSHPDIHMKLEVLNPNMQGGLKCNLVWGLSGNSTHSYPQPGNAVWQADVANGNGTLLISRNDKLYRPRYARSPNTTKDDSYMPYFICNVNNADSKMAAAYRLEAALINDNATLSPAEQTVLANIFSACCQEDNCIEWKAQNNQNGGLMTHFCTVLGQICTPEGHLLRLDLRGAKLQCGFPAADFAAFQWLTTLNLGRNPNLQHLNMESVGAEGVLPSCLFDSGSQLVEVQLDRNNVTGTIPDVFAADSPLEVLALSSNQLIGPLPDSHGTLEYLTEPDVSSNILVGTIPPTLGNIPTLKHVILKFNNMIGVCPYSLLLLPLTLPLLLHGCFLSPWKSVLSASRISR
eukprot:jgi/Botrbrau1/20744/Bobra.0058s0072.1